MRDLLGLGALAIAMALVLTFGLAYEVFIMGAVVHFVLKLW